MDELTKLLERLEHEWAPEVLELAARIVFWDAVGWLLIGVMCAVGAFVLGRASIQYWGELESDVYEHPKDEWKIWGMMGTGLGAAFSTLIAAFILLNIWNWVALFDPRLAVAHRVLELLLRGTQ